VNNSRLNNKIKRESWAATRANASLNNLSPTDVDALIAQYLIDNPVGGGGLPQLAPDLTYPGDRKNQNLRTYKEITGINASLGLTTALSLSGKFAISLLRFITIAPEPMTIKLTIDGVVIWNDLFTGAAATSQYLLGNIQAGMGVSEAIQCNTSFLLEIQTATDTSVDLYYMARPIL
tara:strand:+ start:135 stop:665 length:531 start_codon:yes stop_codon:yes gene_type:complete